MVILVIVIPSRRSNPEIIKRIASDVALPRDDDLVKHLVMAVIFHPLKS